MRLQIVTLNINGKVLPDDFAAILGLSEPGASQNFTLPDVVVFNFQEHVKLDFKHVARDMVSPSGRTARCRVLHDSLVASLPADYGELASEVMLGLYIVAFARRNILDEVANVQTAIVARGIAGLKNKGAAAIRFRHRDRSFCFTNVHSAAADDNVARRNDDIFAATTELKFRESGRDRSNSRSSVSSASTQGSVSGACIEQADYLFIAGDLNYRIDLEHDAVMAAIGRRDWQYLLAHDQLRLEREARRIFVGYVEAPIDFRPTYKFDDCDGVGRHYDTSPKKRTPAYTDRVLWRSDLPVKVVRYASHEVVLVSDHLPVSLTCDV